MKLGIEAHWHLECPKLHIPFKWLSFEIVPLPCVSPVRDWTPATVVWKNRAAPGKAGRLVCKTRASIVAKNAVL